MRKTFDFFVMIFKGMLSGMAGILPGFSGGVMMLVFGIYNKLMYTLSHPIKGIKKYYKIFIPFIAGAAIGFILTAKALASVFTRFEIAFTCLFVGLIFGMLPSLFREAVKEGKTKYCNTGMILTLTVFYVFFEFISRAESINVTPSFPWFIFCGVLWGLSFIVPGMSSSSPLMLLGLYIPMTEGIGNLDMAVIIPWALGLILTVAILSRLVNSLFSKHFALMNHCVIGLVIASTLPIIPTKYPSTPQMFLCILLIGVGIVSALLLDKSERKLRKKYSSSGSKDSL